MDGGENGRGQNSRSGKDQSRRRVTKAVAGYWQDQRMDRSRERKEQRKVANPFQKKLKRKLLKLFKLFSPNSV